MANRDSTGFRIEAGGQNNVRVFRFPVTTSNGTNLFLGDTVKPESNGGVTPLTAGGTGTGMGVVVGLYDSNGVPVGTHSSSVSTRYLPSSTAGYCDVALALPGTIFVGQSQTGTSYAATDIFAAVNLIAGTGNTTLGVSGHELGATGGTDFLLLGIINEPSNSYGVNVDMAFSFLSSFWGQINATGGT